MLHKLRIEIGETIKNVFGDIRDDNLVCWSQIDRDTRELRVKVRDIFAVPLKYINNTYMKLNIFNLFINIQ